MRANGYTDLAVRFAWVLFLTVGCTGCATSQQKPPPPPVLATATVVPPVGGVTPVFIEVLVAGQSSAIAYREDICAFDQNGKCEPALDLEEAARMAGGADKLATALNEESAAGAVGRSVLVSSVGGMVAGGQLGSQMSDPNAQAGAVMLGTAAGLVTGLARGAYVATSPEARYLDQVAVKSLASRTKWYWSANIGAGFVYFSNDKYSRIRVTANSEKPPPTILLLEWPVGTEKTFDIQPLGSQSP